MNDKELAVLAFNSLQHRSLRSWLAILGIVIGVASIISLISISVGMNDQITKNLGGLGANIITITSGAARADRGGGFGGGGAPPGAAAFGGSGSSSAITFREADALRRVAGVAKLDARVQGNARVSYGVRNTSVSIIGTEPSTFPASSGAVISQGRTLGTGDDSSAVIGYSVASQTFNASMLNQRIKIGGSLFRVVGILNSSGTSFGGPDRSIFISQKAAKKLFNKTESVSSVVVVAADGSNPDTVAAALTKELQSLHRVTNETQDFTVTTATTLTSTLSSVTNTLAIFLGGIAFISLVVGMIGVMNAMFTSVLEQTRYIGLLKALGTRSFTIVKLFFYEAVALGIIGGLLGVALSFAGSAILAGFGLPSRITPELIAFGLFVSTFFSAISGVFPAFNAANVAPVEALRYE